MRFFLIWKNKYFFSLSALFVASFLFSEYSFSNDVWKENITVSEYYLDHSCGYGGHAGYNFYRKNFYESDDRNVEERYLIRLKSKYKMFSNYNSYRENLIDHRKNLMISTEVNDIYPEVKFHSREEVYIYINGLDFDKLVKTNSFYVYYPPYIFDKEWKKRLIDRTDNRVVKHNMVGLDGSPIEYRRSSYVHDLDSMLLFFTHLSSGGLEQIRKSCHETVVAKKITFDAQQKEDNKPLNRLKKFFGS